MQVFVYEFITGGGMWSQGSAPPAGSLLAEGRAMARALAADFAAAGVDVRLLRDWRLAAAGVGQAASVGSAAEEREAFMRHAEAADWTVVIAPELAGNLLRRCQWVLEAGGQLLSPGLATVALASDKQRTAEHLARQGIQVPQGVAIESGARTDSIPKDLFPAVIKPLDGCGSQAVQRVDGPSQLQALRETTPRRLERYIPGLAASVAVLCGRELRFALPACEQLLSCNRQFKYLGGRTPLPPSLARRATTLAIRAVRSLPDPFGHIGVDLILGDEPNGRDDCVIEINPRLTTSYVGLRALCRSKLAAAMLAAAQDEEPALSWHGGVVKFSADGRIVTDQCTLEASNEPALEK